MGTRTLSFATVAIVVSLAACSPAPVDGVVSDSHMTLEVANGVSIDVTLVVNGSPVAPIPAGSSIELSASQLPALPWAAEVRSASGRVLVALGVRSGDVYLSATGRGGVAKRVDLSCGRIDIWSGPPLVGPMPGPGVPGDCD